MQHRLSVYPDVGTAEFEALLEAELARRGQAVLERLEHADGHVYPELSRPLDAHGGRVQALTFHQPTTADGVVRPPATVVHHAGDDGGDPVRAPLPLARALSRYSGGWALAMAASRTAERYAVGAFYAGRTIEAVAWDGEVPVLRRGVPEGAAKLADEGGTWSAFASLYRAVTDGSDGDLRWTAARLPVRSWIVSAPGDSGSGGDSGHGEPDLRRAAFIDVPAARVREVLASTGLTDRAPMRLRLAGRSAPLTGAPYVLLDGDFDDAVLVALARRLDTQAAAVEMRGSEEAFTWCAVDLSGRVRAGSDRGAVRMAEVWSALAVTLGEPAAILRWDAAAAAD